MLPLRSIFKNNFITAGTGPPDLYPGAVTGAGRLLQQGHPGVGGIRHRRDTGKYFSQVLHQTTKAKGKTVGGVSYSSVDKSSLGAAVLRANLDLVCLLKNAWIRSQLNAFSPTEMHYLLVLYISF